jgi:hypothetical protein
VIMECIARMVKGEPVGGNLWVNCPNDQCAVLSPLLWRELLILYEAQLAVFEKCYQSRFEANDVPWCWDDLFDPWEEACRSVSDQKHSTKDFTYHLITGRKWTLHQLLSETGARPPADKVVSVLTCMLPGLPADLFHQEPASASSTSELESTTSKQAMMKRIKIKPSVIERITDPDFAEEIDEGRRMFAYTIDDGCSHSHTHCYLDGLLSVDWDVDARSEIRGGYTHAVEIVQQCCRVCQSPMPAMHRTDCPGCMQQCSGEMAILRKRFAERTQTQSWTGPLAGFTRRDYLDAGGDLDTILRFGAKLKKNGVPAGNLRMLICFDN